MSIIATIEIEAGIRDITGTFETMMYQERECTIVSKTDKGDFVGIPMDKDKIAEIDSSFGLAIPRIYKGKLPLASCVVIPKEEYRP